MTTYEQDPTEKQDYQETISGDTIASASWSAEPALTIGTVINTTTSSTVRVSGVEAGKLYTLSTHIVGASGQEYERSCLIRGTLR